MSTMIGEGDSITFETDGGRQAAGTVGAEVGCGGQGCVFNVSVADVSMPGPVVVKWYKEPYSTTFREEQLQAITDLAEVGPPSDCYLWPRALARSAGSDSFGYVMDRRPDGFTDLRHIAFDGSLSYDSMIAFAIQIAGSLQELHTRGLAYRDVNMDNFFVHPDTGAALICDTDNIGFEKRSYMGVMGKDDFMAPEIVCHRSGPNANTDRHSLAVLLFMLFMRWHPLEGLLTEGLMDDDARMEHFGTRPRFCLDPHDVSNRPPAAAGSHVRLYWEWIPSRMRQLFVRAFTLGLVDPQHGRVMESEWLDVLVGLRDSMLYCPSCAGLMFDDAPAGRVCRRPGCGAEYLAPLSFEVRLGTGRSRTVAARAGARLFGYHLRYGYRDIVPVAEVVEHPEQPGVLGLVVTEPGASWQARFADGERQVLSTGDGVILEAGLTVKAGAARVVVAGPDDLAGADARSSGEASR